LEDLLEEADDVLLTSAMLAEEINTRNKYTHAVVHDRIKPKERRKNLQLAPQRARRGIAGIGEAPLASCSSRDDKSPHHSLDRYSS
jgi:hypothetical protein